MHGGRVHEHRSKCYVKQILHRILIFVSILLLYYSHFSFIAINHLVNHFFCSGTGWDADVSILECLFVFLPLDIHLYVYDPSPPPNNKPLVARSWTLGCAETSTLRLHRTGCWRPSAEQCVTQPQSCWAACPTALRSMCGACQYNITAGPPPLTCLRAIPRRCLRAVSGCPLT